MQQENTMTSVMTSSAGSAPPVPIEFEQDPTDMNGLLVDYLDKVRLDMLHSFEQMMRLIEHRSESFQNESARHLDTKMSELRLQNRTLRDQLAKSQAGTDGNAPKFLSSPVVSPENTALQQASVFSPDNFSPSGSKAAEDFKMNTSQGSSKQDSSNGAKRLPSLKGGFTDKEALRRSLAERRRSGKDRRHKASSNSSASGTRKDPNKDSQFSREVTESDSNSILQDLEWSPRQLEHQVHKPSSEVLMSQKLSTRAATKIFGVHVTSHMESQIQSEDQVSNNSKPGSGGQRATIVGQAVFADAQAMKERVRAAVTKPEYNVADYYWDSGICQRIARHTLFEYTTLFVIGANALWIAIEADENEKDFILEAHPVFIIADNVFCCFFVGEWLVRFFSFREKRFVMKDFWFLFDSVLLFIMVMETWVMTLVVGLYGAGLSSRMGQSSVLKLIRLVRLTRMARLAKILRCVPELIILIKGIAVAARSVFFTLTLLFLLIYVFAIVLRQITHDTEIGAKYYASVPKAMRSLLLDAVLPDQAPAVRANGDANLFLGFFLLFFILLSSLTVMNMLVGILCEVVSVVSAVEKEQLAVNFVKQRLETLLGGAIAANDGSRNISKGEFERLLTNGETAKIIQDLGVDLIGLVDFVDIIFEDDVELSFGDFMQLVLQLRGTNNCTVKDMVDLRKFFITELNALHAELNHLGQNMGRLPEEMSMDLAGRFGRRNDKFAPKLELDDRAVPSESTLIQRLHRRNICRV